MRSLLISLVYFSFFFAGISAPFVLVLGYVWVDIFTPQWVAYSILPSIPVSLLMGLACIVSFFSLPKDPNIRMRPITKFVFVFGLWMTMTLLWAEVPEAAYGKWDWAIKCVWFSCLVPFFFRAKMQLDALIWIIVVSGMANCLPNAGKVMLGGGGYSLELGLVGGNTGYGEGSTLAMFAISLIPLCLYLIKHDSLLEKGKLKTIILYGFILAALLASLGTFARTGLVSAAVLGVCLLFQSKRKILYIVFSLIIAVVLFNFMGESWQGRMNTIGDSSEGSAMGRVAVWSWTVDYVLSHPWGGSFDVFRINYYNLLLENGTILTVAGKAFHNIYFEILGELGFPGIFIYIIILFLAYISCFRFSRLKAGGELDWAKHLSTCLLITLTIYSVSGNFIGIAFQSYFYYLVAIVVIIQNLANVDPLSAEGVGGARKAN